MRVMADQSWVRRGVSLLWGAELLAEIVEPREVLSLRQFQALAGNWPEVLPSANGDAVVVAGVEGCLDALCPEHAEVWLEEDLKPRLLDFQEEYEGQAGLVLWLPSGKKRIQMTRSTEAYLWHCGPPHGQRSLEIGRILWAGSQDDAAHILDPSHPNRDPDGPAWVGLSHPRIS